MRYEDINADSRKDKCPLCSIYILHLSLKNDKNKRCFCMKSNVARCVPTEAAAVERKTERAHINDYHINNNAFQRYEHAQLHTSAHQWRTATLTHINNLHINKWMYKQAHMKAPQHSLEKIFLLCDSYSWTSILYSKTLCTHLLELWSCISTVQSNEIVWPFTVLFSSTSDVVWYPELRF